MMLNFQETSVFVFVLINFTLLPQSDFRFLSLR
jgi:hypothetical protein